MLASVGQLLPIALAAALSSVPISIMVVILLSSRRRVAAVPYLLGSVVGIALVVTAAILLAATTLPSRPRKVDPWIGVIEIALGCALLVVAAISWRRRHQLTASGAGSRWTSVIAALTPFRAFGLGLLLDLRPKSLLLATVVGLQLRGGQYDTVGLVVLAAIYVAVATSTITIPILLTILDPGRMEPRLTAAVQFLSARGRTISAVVLAVVAVLVLIVGVRSL